jgi:flagellar basal-body rod modification protein FlgD
MELSGISSNDPISGAPSTVPSQKLDKDAFLKLLVNQVKNQDPMSPTGSTEYVAQLAQFSSLEQMQNLNDNIVGLAVLQQNNALLSQLTQSSALIGQKVEWTDPTTGDARSGQVSAVKLQDGQAVLEIDGEDVPLTSITQVLGQPADGAGASGDGSGAGDTGGADGEAGA